MLVLSTWSRKVHLKHDQQWDSRLELQADANLCGVEGDSRCAQDDVERRLGGNKPETCHQFSRSYNTRTKSTSVLNSYPVPQSPSSEDSPDHTPTGSRSDWRCRWLVFPSGNDNKWTAIIYSSFPTTGHLKCFTILPNIHPFTHSHRGFLGAKPRVGEGVGEVPHQLGLVGVVSVPVLHGHLQSQVLLLLTHREHRRPVLTASRRQTV